MERMILRDDGEPTVFANVAKARKGTTANAIQHRGNHYAVLASDDEVAIFVHEFMHIVEDEQFARQARAFLKYRARRNKFIDPKATEFALEAKTGLVGGQYGPKGWRDDWTQPYTGRAYLFGDGKLAGTEISSMLTEQLFRDPATLMMRDPEAFDFMLNLFRRVPIEQHGWYKSMPPAMREWATDGSFK
jgi:hypothetical protein